MNNWGFKEKVCSKAVYIIYACVCHMNLTEGEEPLLKNFEEFPNKEHYLPRLEIDDITSLDVQAKSAYLFQHINDR